jgi:hypothetical protein
VLAVPIASRFRTLDDFVAAFKADPESISWGGGSAGGSDQMLAGLIAQAVGVDPRRVNYIAFSGGGESLSSVLGGQVSVGINGLAEFEAQMEAGALRALAISSAERLPGVDAKTLREQGLDLEFENWRSVMAPPGLTGEQRRALDDAVGGHGAVERMERDARAVPLARTAISGAKTSRASPPPRRHACATSSRGSARATRPRRRSAAPDLIRCSCSAARIVRSARHARRGAPARRSNAGQLAAPALSSSRRRAPSRARARADRCRRDRGLAARGARGLSDRVGRAVLARRARVRRAPARARRGVRDRGFRRRVFVFAKVLELRCRPACSRAGSDERGASFRLWRARMTTLHSLLGGFAGALTLANLGWALIGTTLGTAIGVLPGIGPRSRWRCCCR